jgi:hypothetical protein
MMDMILAIWNIYLQKKFGFGIIQKIWDLMVEKRALYAIDEALIEYGTSLKNELNEFGEWTYFTNSRAKIGLPYFEYDEAVNYPLIKPLIKINFLPPEHINNFNSNAVSNNFIQYTDNSQGRNDTLTVIVTDGNIIGGLESSQIEISPFTYKLSSNNSSGMIEVAPDYFYNLELTGPNTRIFKENYILNDLANTAILPLKELEYPYPQPYTSEHQGGIHIPVSSKIIDQEAELYIFTISMDYVFSDKLRVTALDVELRNEPNIVWNGKDDDGNKVPAGIYIFVTKRGNEIIKGKLAILNE